MRKAELQNYKKLIADYYDGREIDGADSLAEMLKAEREAARHPQDTDLQAAMRLVEGGNFGIYYTDIEGDLSEVYGEDYKTETYRTKSGEFRTKHGEVYIWTVYKAKMAQAINAIIDGVA